MLFASSWSCAVMLPSIEINLGVLDEVRYSKMRLPETKPEDLQDKSVDKKQSKNTNKGKAGGSKALVVDKSTKASNTQKKVVDIKSNEHDDMEVVSKKSMPSYVMDKKYQDNNIAMPHSKSSVMQKGGGDKLEASVKLSEDKMNSKDIDKSGSKPKKSPDHYVFSGKNKDHKDVVVRVESEQHSSKIDDIVMPDTTPVPEVDITSVDHAPDLTIQDDNLESMMDNAISSDPQGTDNAISSDPQDADDDMGDSQVSALSEVSSGDKGIFEKFKDIIMSFFVKEDEIIDSFDNSKSDIMDRNPLNEEHLGDSVPSLEDSGVFDEGDKNYPNAEYLDDPVLPTPPSLEDSDVFDDDIIKPADHYIDTKNIVVDIDSQDNAHEFGVDKVDSALRDNDFLPDKSADLVLDLDDDGAIESKDAQENIEEQIRRNNEAMVLEEAKKVSPVIVEADNQLEKRLDDESDSKSALPISLHFEAGSSVLNEHHYDKVSMLTQIINIQPGDILQIVSYATGIGNTPEDKEASARKVSLQRVIAIRKALIDRGMDASILKIKALSEMEMDKNNILDGVEFYIMHSASH